MIQITKILTEAEVEKILTAVERLSSYADPEMPWGGAVQTRYLTRRRAAVQAIGAASDAALEALSSVEVR